MHVSFSEMFQVWGVKLWCCCLICKSSGVRKYEESTNSRFTFARQVEISLKKNDQVLMMFASMSLNSEASSVDFPVVCEFRDLLPKGIIDFPSECEVEFFIDLVLGTRHVDGTI